MNERKCLIIGNNDVSCDILGHLQRLLIFDIESHLSFLEASKVVASRTVDIIFYYPQANENAEYVLELLKKLSPMTRLVIVSDSIESAVKFYNDGVITDFLINPVEYRHFLRAVDKSLGLKITPYSLSEQDFTFFKVGRKLLRFDHQSIDFIQAYGMYSKVFQGSKVLLISEPMASLVDMLPIQFKRVHKSYVINIGKITGFDFKNLYINDLEVPIGISYRSHVEGLLNIINR